jgi:CrcB protein
MTLVLVGIFGGLGALVRWVCEYLVRRRHPVARPWGTVGANVLGCAIAGLVVTVVSKSTSPHLHSILLTGFCGGLTTFSSAFAVPAILNREHHWKYATSLVVATPILCALGYWLGVAVGK